MQAGAASPSPPAPLKYAATLEVLALSAGVDVVRASSGERMAEVEFSQRHGTTTNSYLLKARCEGVFI